MFTIAMAVLLLAALLAAALIKASNQDLSLATVRINSSFNQFMMMLTGQVVTMQRVNYLAYTNNTEMATALFQFAPALANITAAMDNLVVNFDINSITQTWNTLTCNATSGRFILGNENSFLTVSDFIQNPVTNLLATKVAAFSFPPFLSAQTLPMGSSPCLYFTLMLNSLYITIPSFLNLKASVMDGILLKNVSVSLAMILILLAVFLISLFYVIGKAMMNMRVTRLKNEAYEIFESLAP